MTSMKNQVLDAIKSVLREVLIEIIHKLSMQPTECPIETNEWNQLTFLSFERVSSMYD